MTGPRQSAGVTNGAGFADIVVTNARVYTVDPLQPWAEAIAIVGNRIAFVGSSEDAKELVGPSTHVANADRRLVLPGFVESHVHLLVGAASNSGASIAMSDSITDILRKVDEFAHKHPEREAIFGASYNGLLFDERGPNRALLDRIVPDRPVVLIDHTVHSAWANSKALELAGVTADTPDPLPGFFVRDSQGEPTGCIKGSPAHAPVIAAVKAVTAQSIMDALPAILRGMSAFGFTAALDCGNTLFTDQSLQALHELELQGQLPVRTSLTAITNNTETSLHLIPDARRFASMYATEMMWLDTVKILGDSVLDNQTAALLEPYLTTGDSGYLYFEATELQALVAEAAKAGFGIVYHAIGDRTARTGLDAAEALRASGDHTTRFVITHLQLVNKSDRHRFGELNVHVQTTGNWANFQSPYVELLGAQRADEDQFPFRDFLDGGANVCFGADWPATPGGFDLGMNPFINMYTAMHRRVPRQYIEDFASKDQILKPADQVLTLAEVIEAYTINGAKALGREQQFGSLVEGKFADLIVLDQNLFEIDPEDVPNTRVLLTIMDGRVVHDLHSLEIT